MCRHLAWYGAPRTVAGLVLDPPHGLLRQSWAPRRQAHGTVNADGWGVGLLPDDGSAPVRWRSERPIWSDTNLASVAPHLRSGRVIAAVRSATVGMPLDASAVAPFCHDGWLVSHNGVVAREAVRASLDAGSGLPESLCDSALLAAHVVAAGVDHLDATLHKLSAADPAARLNLLLLSHDELVAVAWGDTLSYRAGADGMLAASEPDDTPGWVDVPDRHVLRVSAGGVEVTPLEA